MMKSFYVLLLLLAISNPFKALAQLPGAAEYKLLKPVMTAGIADYIKVDPEARRAYVGWGFRVSVFNIDSGKLVGEVAGVARAHGVALVPGNQHAYASAGGTNEVVEFDKNTFVATRRIKAGTKPDTMLYDPFSKRVFAMNGNDGTATVIDPAAPDKDPVTVPIFPDGGHLEAAAPDGLGHIFASVVNKGKIAVLDTKQMKVTAIWDLGADNHPMGIIYDATQQRLYIGCAPQTMIIMDARTGKIIGQAPIGKTVDAVGYDASLGIAVASCTDGVLSVVREGPSGTFTTVQTLKTVPFARTLSIDTKTHQIFLPAMIPPRYETGAYGLVVVGLAPGSAAAKPKLRPGEIPPTAPGGPGELQVLKTISTRGTAEYGTFDVESRKMYVAQGARAAIFDVDEGKLAGEVTNIPVIHMVMRVPGRDEAYASSGAQNEIVVFDTNTLKVIRKISLNKPEYFVYDASSKKIFVIGDKEIYAIDPAASSQKPVLVKIGSEIEQAAADGAGRLYLTGDSSDEILVFDTKAMKIEAKWSIAPNRLPRGVALDQGKHRLYVGCAMSETLAVVDTRTGKILASLPAGKDINGVVFDPKQNAAMVANGLDGTLTVVRESAGSFDVVQTLKTAAWARTLVIDPKTGNVLLPSFIGGGNPDGTILGHYGYQVVGTNAPASVVKSN